MHARRPEVRSRGTETLLVVEDEGFVRDLIRRTLRTPAATQVLRAESRRPGDARSRCPFEGQIELLLTDIVLPRRSHLALYSAIRTHRPAMRVLFISGFVSTTRRLMW